MAVKEQERQLPKTFESKQLPAERIDPAAVAAAEAAKARIQSAYLMALHNPRNFDMARIKILDACKRPAFADKVEYSKPVGGKKIKGPSIRFAELAIREWGNLLTETSIVYEDDKVRRLHILVIDLETNAQHGQEIAISKTVERKKPAADREILGQRLNTQGETVYILSATEDELFNKQNAMISKIKRNEGLRLIPTDIIDDAIEQAQKTLKDQDKKDPGAAKKKILDAFSDLGIKPNAIAQYLKHTLDTITLNEIEDLRAMYRAIKEGEASFQEYLDKGSGEEKDEKEEKAEEEPISAAATEIIKKFDAIVEERKIDHKIFDPWLKELAEANELTLDKLKISVMSETDENKVAFWLEYETHVGMVSSLNKPKEESKGLFANKKK